MRTLSTLLLLHLFTALLSVAQEVHSPVERFLEKNYDVRFTDGNSIELLPTGREKFAALERDLKQAKEFIHMDYFNFRYDSISRVIFDILRERAAEGVEVRVVIDAYGNGKSPRALHLPQIKKLRRAGVDVRIFDRVVFPFFNHFFHRDHRKIVIIDGTIGYIGGMNIADYYIHGKGNIVTWRDMHLRLTGPAVADLQRVFIPFWNKQTHQNVQGSRYYETGVSGRGEQNPCKDSEGCTCNNPTGQHAPATARVGVVNRTPSNAVDWPRRNTRIARDALRSAIDNAKHNIQIVNPYFAPSRMIRQALKRAIKRGVRVEIMISRQSDVRVTPRIVENTCHGLMRHGAEIYMYEDGFHHSKTMTVDDSLSYVGSVNLDHRSLYSDYECNLMITDRSTNERLRHIFESDKERSTLLTPTVWKTRFSPGHRLRCRLATILRPLV